MTNRKDFGPMSEKTNAVRLLEQHHIPYQTYAYDVKDGLIDGISVAHKTGKSEKEVFKTLVTQGASGDHYVFVIPVCAELDLKKAAKAAKEKYIEMIPAKDIVRITGYMKGGCSPVGMKKHFATFIDEDGILLETIIVSAGKIGLQMALEPQALLDFIGAQWFDLKKE